MKLQNFAVIFIVIVLPIALILSVYTGNLIDVANKQAEYDSILLNSTYDAVRAYQLNTLKNTYESATNSKVRDINASVTSFFNSLATGLSSSGYGKNELTDYVPAMLYTLYDGYYVYGSYSNIVDLSKLGEEEGIYSKKVNGRNRQYGIKPYVYYSCEYAKEGQYDLIVNYTLDNYITVTGTYKNTSTNNWEYITQSGYYINFNAVSLNTEKDAESRTSGPASFSNKIVKLYKDTENEVVISPEKLGEYLTTYDTYVTKEGNSIKTNNYALSEENKNNGGKAKYYNYIMYNNIKYYLDIDHRGTYVDRDENGNNLCFNMTYDGYPIFFLDGDRRIYISKSTFDELKSYLGIVNDEGMYRVDPVGDDDAGKECFRDVNAYYYYYNSTQFSQRVYDALKNIDLGTSDIKDENGNNVKVIASNIPYDEEGKLPSNNVIKTKTYHTNYTTTNGVESHTKSTYDDPKVFEFDDEGKNDPELASSSFNRHRIDVIISSIESSLVSTIGSFNDYIGGTYDYSMPVLTEDEWDRICNNVTVVSFMQGMTIGNYKYYSSYAIVANTKVKDFIPKESIFVQNASLSEDQEYHNPRCEDYNTEKNKDAKEAKEVKIVGYRNVDYDRQNCIVPNSEGKGGAEYFYYLQQGQAGYECVVNLNGNKLTTDELLSGIEIEREEKIEINPEIRRAYITALAREKGNSYKTYGFLNEELQQKTTLSQGEALYTVRYFYQDYDYTTNSPIYGRYTENISQRYSSTALVGTYIKSLKFNKTPSYGYYYTGEIYLYNPSTGLFDLQIGSNEERLKANTTTEIAIYFDVDTNQTKTLFYNIEFWLWNRDTASFDYRETRRIEDKRWINTNNNLKVNIPLDYGDYSLVLTDPDGFVNQEKEIATGSTIKAYYSVPPDYSQKHYYIRYHTNVDEENTTEGEMETSVYKFYEKNTLPTNKFTREGYMFNGWALTPEGDAIYPDSGSIVQVDASNMKTEDDEFYLDLYATWIKAAYQINYQSNGATSGTMKNSLHEFDVPKSLNKNEYKREFNITLNVGPGKTNFYNGLLSKWGDSSIVTYDKYAEEYSMTIIANASKYSGLYYPKKDAILKPGKTATISYEVYADRNVTLALKIQNSVVGEDYSEGRHDGSDRIQPVFVNINAGEWVTVYFSYKNNTDKEIYDYSILSIEDTNQEAVLKIKNPKFEITNASLEQGEGTTKKAKISSEFLYWEYDGKNYKDEEQVLNLTNTNGTVLTMIAQWKDFSFNLPELNSPGYKFLGWFDEDGNIIDPDEPVDITKDRTITARWDDNTPPEVDIQVVNTTTSTITTQTTIKDEGSGLKSLLNYTYYIKEKGLPDSYWQEFDGYQMDEYTFYNLKHNTPYEIRVVVDGDNAGNTGTDNTLGTTRELTGNIFVKSQKWYQNENREGSQTITFGSNNLTSDDVYIEYRREEEEEWHRGYNVYEVEHGHTVFARLTDGVNYLASISALAWDDILPKFDIRITTATEDKPDSIKIEIETTEEESGLGKNPEYSYWIKKDGENEYKLDGKTTETTYTFKGLEYITKYNIRVTVSDRAGNIGFGFINEETTYRYVVEYNGNGATSGSMPNQIQTKDIDFQIAKNLYLRTGYNYTGKWKHGKTEELYDDLQWVTNISPDTTKVILYAQWIDDIKPDIFSLNKSTNEIVKSLTLTATTQDLGTGIVGWQFSKTENLDINSPGWTTIDATNQVLTAEKEIDVNGTWYFYVKDGAGNMNKTSIMIDNIIPKDIDWGPNDPTNPYYEWTVEVTGYYSIRLVGGGGPQTYTNYSGGSNGGKVDMEIYAVKGSKLYVVVGGQGKTVGPNAWDPGAGGYNGGGNGGYAIRVNRNGGIFYNAMTAGTGGGGATTIANSLANSIDGKLANYQNRDNAMNYIIGVAAGGGGAADRPAITRFGKSEECVDGGDPRAGTSGIFGKGQDGGSFLNVWWTETRETGYPDSTEGPSGGGAGWSGGWANQSYSTPRGQPERCKTPGEGGSNYITSKKSFSAGANNVNIITITQGEGSNAGGNGSATIKYLRAQ